MPKPTPAKDATVKRERTRKPKATALSVVWFAVDNVPKATLTTFLAWQGQTRTFPIPGSWSSGPMPEGTRPNTEYFRFSGVFHPCDADAVSGWLAQHDVTVHNFRASKAS